MSSPLSHRVTYFFFHSLFRDLPLRLSRMPCRQRLHQRREPGPRTTGRGEGLSTHGPRPPSFLITVRVRPETPCGMEAEPGRAARTSPSTGLRAASPVTVDYCPIVGGVPPTPACGATSTMGGMGLGGFAGSPGVQWNTETSGGPGLLIPIVASE